MSNQSNRENWERNEERKKIYWPAIREPNIAMEDGHLLVFAAAPLWTTIVCISDKKQKMYLYEHFMMLKI